MRRRIGETCGNQKKEGGSLYATAKNGIATDMAQGQKSDKWHEANAAKAQIKEDMKASK